ncbi:MAG: hypothetical protein LBT50_04590 [Prevotellaceae bacterium]|jgi:hypothetical protein|nr:hypothetical protein [Prevotellaceae bacterium]
MDKNILQTDKNKFQNGHNENTEQMATVESGQDTNLNAVLEKFEEVFQIQTQTIQKLVKALEGAYEPVKKIDKENKEREQNLGTMAKIQRISNKSFERIFKERNELLDIYKDKCDECDRQAEEIAELKRLLNEKNKIN